MRTRAMDQQTPFPADASQKSARYDAVSDDGEHWETRDPDETLGEHRFYRFGLVSPPTPPA